MLKVDEAVPRIEELIRTLDPGWGIVAWSDGRITLLPPDDAEDPEPARDPHEPWIVAKFIVGEGEPAWEQEIRDRLNVGLAAGGEWHH